MGLSRTQVPTSEAHSASLLPYGKPRGCPGTCTACMVPEATGEVALRWLWD